MIRLRHLLLLFTFICIARASVFRVKHDDVCSLKKIDCQVKPHPTMCGLSQVHVTCTSDTIGSHYQFEASLAGVILSTSSKSPNHSFTFFNVTQGASYEVKCTANVTNADISKFCQQSTSIFAPLSSPNITELHVTQPQCHAMSGTIDIVGVGSQILYSVVPTGSAPKFKKSSKFKIMAGEYDVQISDGYCNSAIRKTKIENPQIPEVRKITVQEPECIEMNSGIINVEGFGREPLLYSLVESGKPAQFGEHPHIKSVSVGERYDLQVMDSYGCPSSIKTTSVPLPSLPLLLLDNATCYLNGYAVVEKPNHHISVVLEGNPPNFDHFSEYVNWAMDPGIYELRYKNEHCEPNPPIRINIVKDCTYQR